MPIEQAQRMSKQGGARVRFPPPLVFAGAILLGWFVPLGIGLAPALRWALGGLLIAAAVALVGTARGLFVRTGQNPVPWTPSPELILQGPYRYTRNPMYVGMTLLTLGVGLAAGHAGVMLLAPVALLAVHFIAVLPEERYLAAKFGEPYLEFKSRVRRYL
jgi:protein-S-isoprenylcysteine O-methyltransferase Ste14